MKRRERERERGREGLGGCDGKCKRQRGRRRRSTTRAARRSGEIQRRLGGAWSPRSPLDVRGFVGVHGQRHSSRQPPPIRVAHLVLFSGFNSFTLSLSLSLYMYMYVLCVLYMFVMCYGMKTFDANLIQLQ